MSRNITLKVLVAIISVVVLASCSPTEVEPGVPATTVAEVRAPRVEPVEASGEPEIRDLQPTNELVSNCGGVTESVVKHPSITVGSSHSVEWEVGGTTGVGLEIGSDLMPAKVNLDAALEGSLARDLSNSIQHGNAWDLPAEPGYIMEYTVMWREVWQPGYIDVTFFDPEPDILRIDVKYRTGVQSEIVGQNRTSCGSTPVTDSTVVPPASTSVPANTPSVSSNSADNAASPISFIDLPVNSETGVVWTVPTTGMFSFSIESGAYNGWPTDSECANAVPDRPGCWRTRLNVYVGCEIDWQRPSHSPEMSEPLNPSFALGDFTYMESMEAAENFAITLAPHTDSLNEGDCLRFVAIDGYNPETGYSAYTDNRGDPNKNNMMRIRITGPQ